MSNPELEIYYYSNIEYSKSENRLNYVNLNSSNKNNSYDISKSVNLYNQNGILNGKYTTSSTYYNFIDPIDNIYYVRNILFTIVTNNGILSGIYGQINNVPTPGEIIEVDILYKTNYYYGKNIKCTFQVLDDVNLTRKITIYIH